MTLARIGFFSVLCFMACLWSVPAIMGQTVRMTHRQLVATIRSDEGMPDPRELVTAIAKDQRMLRIMPCNTPLRDEQALLLAQKADMLLAADAENQDAAMLETQGVLAARLSCTPTDGKAWLDYAMLSTYREGITLKAIAAYEMSARVAPGESWLAEKRLLFALSFRAVFNDTARATVLNDIAVLRRAHPNRMTAVMNEAQVKTPEQLASLFETPKP